MAKHRRLEPEASGGESTPGHYGREQQRGPIGEQLPCLVIRATADGYVVGRALVDAAAVTWVSPTHVRPWLETRPTDVAIPAVKEANLGGNVELRPARLAKGVPVQTVVGHHVVFGESLDAAALRAKGELKKQLDAVVKGRRPTWRHLCQEHSHGGLPVWVAVPRGEACPYCRAVEAKKASAA